jgi:hypothetical protein
MNSWALLNSIYEKNEHITFFHEISHESYISNLSKYNIHSSTYTKWLGVFLSLFPLSIFPPPSSSSVAFRWHKMLTSGLFPDPDCHCCTACFLHHVSPWLRLVHSYCSNSQHLWIQFSWLHEIPWWVFTVKKMKTNILT